MSESLRILILEDNPTDVDLIQFELREAGFIFTAKVAKTEKEFISKLQEFSPDLILSDYDLPQYKGALALAEAKRTCPDTPFILVTGAVSEDRAIEIFTQGAKDYVLKPRLQQRLVPAVKRAIAEAEEHRGRKQAEEALRKSQQFFSATIDALTTHICVLDEAGAIVSVNKAWLDFASANPPAPENYRVGADYLDVCDRVVGADAKEAKAFAAGIRSVIKGDQDEFSLEYPCHSPSVQRWFIGRVTRFMQEGSTWIVVAHENITERKQAEETIKQMVYHDTLTGIPNRKLLSDRLGIALSQARRNQNKIGIAMLDLDNFKGVNDTLGHDAGDQLLKATAERLTAMLRKGDTVARFGGDEFVMVLPEMKMTENAIRVAQKIVNSFRAPFLIGSLELVVTISIGIAIYPDDGIDEGILLKNADIAMYQAKHSGRDQYRIYKKD